MAIQWERGIGTYNATDNTLSRDTILATSESDNATIPCDFIAGTKTVTSHIPADPPPTDGFVILPGIGAPPPTNGGVISMKADEVDGLDANRCGPEAATVFFVPNFTPATINLLQVKVTAFLWIAVPLNTSIEYVDCLIGINGDQNSLSIDMGIASPIPFLKDAAKLPANAGIVAGVPADLFAYLPLRNRGAVQPRPVLFYMNWYSATARNNGNAGFPIGHDIAEDQPEFPNLVPWRYLAVNGPFSTYITDTNDYAKLRKRYCYIGTVAGLSDGRVACQGNKRLHWNNMNPISYDLVQPDFTPFWDIVGAANAINQTFEPMNAGDAPSDSPWRFYFLKTGTIFASSTGTGTPEVKADVTFNGNCRINITSTNGPGAALAVLGNAAGNNPLVSTNLASDFLPAKSLEFLQLGFGKRDGGMGVVYYQVGQASGSSAAGPASRIARKRFFGHGANVVLPGVPINPPREGIARMRIDGTT